MFWGDQSGSIVYKRVRSLLFYVRQTIATKQSFSPCLFFVVYTLLGFEYICKATIITRHYHRTRGCEIELSSLCKSVGINRFSRFADGILDVFILKKYRCDVLHNVMVSGTTYVSIHD